MKDRNEQAPVDKIRIPRQYPSMKPKEVVINMVSTLTDMEINDCDKDTNDDVMQCTSAFVDASRAYSSTQTHRAPIDPPGLVDESSNPIESSGKFQGVVINVRAHFEYANHFFYKNKIYLIADGGADSCILGKHVKVIYHTGMYANLVWYDPSVIKTDKVPIESATSRLCHLPQDSIQ
jgi:hypothetical protein